MVPPVLARPPGRVAFGLGSDVEAIVLGRDCNAATAW